VFTSPQDPTKPLGAQGLGKADRSSPQENQDPSRLRFACPAAIPFLKAGEHTDPFTLQYVAGHDNIKNTIRYVYPQEEAVHRLFARLGTLERLEGKWAERPEGSGSVHPVQWLQPSGVIDPKFLNLSSLNKCGSGGTGRHTILRGWRREAWGFKSPLPHHKFLKGIFRLNQC
jgi:hypothetical protein